MNVQIQIQNVLLSGELEVPDGASGLVIMVSVGSGRLSPRSIFVSGELNNAGMGTLMLDILTEEEAKDAKNRSDVEKLTERLIGVTKWAMEEEKTKHLKIAYFASEEFSSVVLSAAAYWGTKIFAIVSWSGKPDLTMDVLDLIEAPTLLIVGGEDKKAIELNRKAYAKIGCVKKMEIIAGATHFMEEPGALEKMTELAKNWFEKHLFKESVE